MYLNNLDLRRSAGISAGAGPDLPEAKRPARAGLRQCVVILFDTSKLVVRERIAAYAIFQDAATVAQVSPAALQGTSRPSLRVARARVRLQSPSIDCGAGFSRRSSSSAQ